MLTVAAGEWDSAKEFAIFNHILFALGLRITEEQNLHRRDISKAAGAGA